MSISGELRPPLLADSARFSRAVFQWSEGVEFQHMDQTFLWYAAAIDTAARTISLKNGSDTTWQVALAYQHPSPNRLTVEGDVDGSHLRMLMTFRDLDKSLRLSRGFHWVQQQAFIR